MTNFFRTKPICFKHPEFISFLINPMDRLLTEVSGYYFYFFPVICYVV